MNKVGSGFGRLSGSVERAQNDAARKSFDKRTQDTGRFPGTHSLGAEFRTK